MLLNSSRNQEVKTSLLGNWAINKLVHILALRMLNYLLGKWLAHMTLIDLLLLDKVMSLLINLRKLLLLLTQMFKSV